MGLDISHYKLTMKPTDEIDLIFIEEDFTCFPSSERVIIPPYIQTINYDSKTQLGFYAIDVGYQRKGMNQDFYERFCSDIDIYCFSRYEDFQFAYNCVDFYWPSDTKEEVEERRIAFKRNFLDNFEEGKSFICVSY